MRTKTPNTMPPMSGSELFIHNVDSAPAYWWLDTLWIVLAEAKDTGGRFSMMEELLRKDSGPGPHKHTWSDETFLQLPLAKSTEVHRHLALGELTLRQWMGVVAELLLCFQDTRRKIEDHSRFAHGTICYGNETVCQKTSRRIFPRQP